MNAVRALTDTLNSWLLDAVEYMRPAAIQRRHNERVLTDMREELRRLPMDAQGAYAEADRAHKARHDEIKRHADLQAIYLNYEIKRAELLLGGD